MEDQLRSKVVAGLFWSLGQAWFQQLISLFVFIILARLLSPADFGTVAIAMVLLGVLTLFVQQGFATSIIQRQNLEEGHLNAAFWMNFMCGVLLAIVAFASAGPIARFYGSPELLWVIRLLSVNLVIFSLTEVQRALLSKKLDFKRLALRTLLSTVVGGAVGVGMAFAGFGVYSLVGQHLATSLAALLVLWSTTSWYPTFRVRRRHLGDLWGFGLNVLGSQLLNQVRRHGDVLIISIFFGPVIVGYYSVALKPIHMIVTLFSKVVSRVALPAFSAMQAMPERLARAVCRSMKFVAIFLLPAVAALALFGDYVVRVAFGEDWGRSGTMLQLVAFWGLIQSVLNLIVQPVLAKGRPGLVTIATGSLAVASPLAMFAAVPFGYHAVIIANIATAFVLGGMFFVRAKTVIGFSWGDLFGQVRGAFTAVAGFVAVALLVRGAAPENWEAIAGLAAGGAVYLAILLTVEGWGVGTLRQALRIQIPRKAAAGVAEK